MPNPEITVCYFHRRRSKNLIRKIIAYIRLWLKIVCLESTLYITMKQVACNLFLLISVKILEDLSLTSKCVIIISQVNVKLFMSEQPERNVRVLPSSFFRRSFYLTSNTFLLCVFHFNRGFERFIRCIHWFFCQHMLLIVSRDIQHHVLFFLTSRKKENSFELRSWSFEWRARRREKGRNRIVYW